MATRTGTPEPNSYGSKPSRRRWSASKYGSWACTRAPAALPGLELFVDGRNAVEREPFDRAGVGYVGIGR